MTGPALRVSGLGLRFGSVVAFEDVNFSVEPGELFAVIGPNGAGKTSLFNVLSRVYTPSAGSVRLGDRDLLALKARQLAAAGVGRTFQNLALYGDMTVLDNVLIGRHHLMRSGFMAGGLWFGRARREERVHREAAREALAFVGAESCADARPKALPYGTRKKIELARALAMEPGLLMLDEPVAGMSEAERAEITELVQRVHRERGLTMLLVEHDMGMVMQVAQRVLVLDFGRQIACDVPAVVQRDPEVIRAYLGEELQAA
ncbi:MAG TPA: ABC transporter ATP-binding protein [Solirubrobacteraceae bacterium]|jgi:branched-chain amino acid transport system ATP-binding protein|nr:ABC transporter ATP-binding protein [Solirubrobacteraceae bacterium]